MCGWMRLNLDPAEPPAPALAREDQHALAEVEKPFWPHSELLPGVRDVAGVAAHPVVPEVRAGEIRERDRPVPFDVLGLQVEDLVDVRPVDRVVYGFEGVHVCAHPL